jgi:60 kDa SS-A/Ro ribonucleoprotein
MTRYSKIIKASIPQTEPLPGQVQNNAGGYSFQIDEWKRLERFLILGSEGGSYYVNERKLTLDNISCIEKCLALDGERTVKIICEVGSSTRAPKQSPAILALAVAASKGDPGTKHYALSNLDIVCRTATHLFEFLEYAQQMRGWGRQLRRAVGNWYLSHKSLVYQVLKYRNRGGWTHRDVLRLCHVKADEPENSVLHWVVKGEWPVAADDKFHPIAPKPEEIDVFERLQKPADEKEVIALIKHLPKFVTWEMVPTEFLGSAKVWQALLPEMPITAMIRNLGRMTANGCLKPMADEVDIVIKKLQGDLKKARIHPIAVLSALRVYQSGSGVRGGLTWKPITQIIDALDDAFYKAFDNVESTGKRLLIGIDVSGSMSSGTIAGIPGLAPRDASAALALVTAKTEQRYHIMGFCNEFVPLDISPKSRLDDVIRKIHGLNFGATDCSLPMIYAMNNNLEVDCFQVVTDNETWAGAIHPAVALKNYRKKSGIPAKSAVIGVTATEFSIADPNDAGQMDFVGFDTSGPQVLADFIKS